jgi:hypothetical protein
MLGNGDIRTRAVSERAFLAGTDDFRRPFRRPCNRLGRRDRREMYPEVMSIEL